MVNPSLLLESKLLALDAAHQMREEDFLMWEVLFILPFPSCANCSDSGRRRRGWGEADFSAARLTMRL
jgi:hypothetical protein